MRGKRVLLRILPLVASIVSLPSSRFEVLLSTRQWGGIVGWKRDVDQEQMEKARCANLLSRYKRAQSPCTAGYLSSFRAMGP